MRAPDIERRACAWCHGSLPPRRRRFCSDDLRRRGQKAERVTENDDYAKAVVRQITRMGTRASDDLYALGWLAGAVDHARSALAMAVDGCRARGYSDGEIGAALGITRQAVWKRFPRQPKVDARPAGTSGAA
jgi:DNA-directed RNA polymerase specialized sigma24 family protein